MESAVKMMFVIILLFFVHFQSFQVFGQVCTKSELKHKNVLKSYSYLSVETYRGNCWYNSNCVKRRRVSKIGNRHEPKIVYETRRYCCDGYTKKESESEYYDEDDYNDENSLVCLPICSPPCINGVCERPGHCTCKPGYEEDSARPHTCKISPCEPECVHGECTAPNICTCNNGYQLTNESCQPICTEPCQNATCTAPDTCECLNGYRKSSNNVCEPYCSKGCTNGFCYSPETCKCNEGYQHDNDMTCIPICEPSCRNSTCIAPNICECWIGYQKINDVCEPICEHGCENGKCIGPDTCECDNGWELLLSQKCVPVCDPPCEKGDCVEPNTCKCQSGYKKSENNTCVPFCTLGCGNGTCVEPEFCECYAGHSKNSDNICVPDCEPPCGNGTCAAPNICDCYFGYEIRNNESKTKMNNYYCKPKCHNCEGECIAPNTCICNPPYEAITIKSAANDCTCDNCSSTKCLKVICMYVHTSSFEKDVSDANESSSTSTLNTNSPLYTTDVHNYTNTATEAELKETNTKDNNAVFGNTDSVWNTYWIYILVSSGALLVAILILLLIMRKARKHFIGSSYVVSKKDTSKADSSTIQSCEVRLSTLQNR